MRYKTPVVVDLLRYLVVDITLNLLRSREVIEYVTNR